MIAAESISHTVKFFFTAALPSGNIPSPCTKPVNNDHHALQSAAWLNVNYKYHFTIFTDIFLSLWFIKKPVVTVHGRKL